MREPNKSVCHWWFALIIIDFSMGVEEDYPLFLIGRKDMKCCCIAELVLAATLSLAPLPLLATNFGSGPPLDIEGARKAGEHRILPQNDEWDEGADFYRVPANPNAKGNSTDYLGLQPSSTCITYGGGIFGGKKMPSYQICYP